MVKTWNRNPTRRRRRKPRTMKGRLMRVERRVAMNKPEAKHARFTGQIELAANQLYNQSTSDPSVYCIRNITSIPQGTGISQRIGHRIRAVFVEVRLWNVYGFSASTYTGFAMVCLTMIKDSQHVIPDLTSGGTTNVTRFMDDPDKYWTMKQERIDYGAQIESTPASVGRRQSTDAPMVMFDKKMNMPIEFQSSGTEPTGKSLAVWLRPYKGNVGAARYMNYEFRMWYYDA